MPKPQQFIFSTDYPTLKQQTGAGALITLPGSLVIGPNGTLETHGDATVGTVGSLLRTRISSSFNGNEPLVGDAVIFNRTGTISGSPVPYSVLAIVYRISPTQLRFQAFIQNPYGANLTTQAGTDAIKIWSVCFLAPYA